MIDVEKVRNKVQTLVKQMAISKTKLGEILGGKTKREDPRVQINRANRFLSGAKKTISLEEVNSLAVFFGKPIEWFLFAEELTQQLASSEKYSPKLSKPLEEIRKNLEKMGFDKDFIEGQITQLKAMEAYRSNMKSS